MAGSNCGDTPSGNVHYARQYSLYVSTAISESRLNSNLIRMADLIGFEGFLNESTPFKPGEHKALWKGERKYPDFSIGNDELAECDYPRFYGEDGFEVHNLSTYLVSCRNSDFDQYGDVAAFGIYPEWYVTAHVLSVSPDFVPC